MRPRGRQHAQIAGKLAIADDQVMLGLIMVELIDFEAVRAGEIGPLHLIDEDFVTEAMDRLPQVGSLHQLLSGKGK
jgi:hypothetical protein